MKKLLLSATLFFTCQFTGTAQTLYSTTLNGINGGGGPIIKFMPSSNNLSVVKNFEKFIAYPGYGHFIQASDGKLYGTTSTGGGFNLGALFSFDPSTSNYTILKDFNEIDGSNPASSLLQASDGKLYGTATSGGTGGGGVIFSYDPVSATYTKLKELNYADGSQPRSALLQVTEGKFYGMTYAGGSSGAGVIFSYDLHSSVYSKLLDFDNINGANPYGDLMLADNGKIYGMTYGGGNNSLGVIFSMDPSNDSFTKLQDFDNINGAYPLGSLVQAKDGKLYGMTSHGGTGDYGIIFSFTTLSSTSTNLVEFDFSKGVYPQGTLVETPEGRLYGMANGGNGGSEGVIFYIGLQDPSNLIKVKDFAVGDGSFPIGSLLQASDGKLYGMTYQGGNGIGVIFSFDPSVNTYTKLKELGNNYSGSFATGSLTKGKDGKLYGMTSYGGAFGYGVIFSLDPLTSVYTKLQDFDKINGANPFGNLIQANDGNLYGMTVAGGTYSSGVIFLFDPLSLTYLKVKDFYYPDGAYPSGSLVQANDGKLYGVTGSGGTSGLGVIFSFDPISRSYQKLKEFDDFANGGFPNGNLVQASDGNLYGMTTLGGNNSGGVIFSFNPSALVYTKLKNFNNDDGSHPYGNLIEGRDGKLYGVTEYGGNNLLGVIFSFDPLSLVYSKLWDFDSSGGHTPFGTLLQTSDGKLYGMTYSGGTNNLGVIFSMDPASSAYTKLQDFNGVNGANAFRGSGFIEVNDCIAHTIYYLDADGDTYGDPLTTTAACSPPAGYVTDNTDCNDNDAAIHSPVAFYRDADRDGLGNPNDSITICEIKPPWGYVRNNYDCNDHFKQWKPWDRRLLMCHNGREECVKISDVRRKLHHGWTLGPCISNCDTRLSKNLPDEIEKEEIFDKLQSTPGLYKFSNYPNPFAGTTSIQFELPFDSKVSIKVYDVVGRVVATLVNENKKAGVYMVNFNASHISRGALYCRMIAISKEQQFIQTNKMIQLQ